MPSDEIPSRPTPAAHARLRYGQHRSQFGDLYLPVAPGAPLVVALHGGSWRVRHDLRELGHLCAALAREGFAVWNVEYRRVGEPGGGWPGTFDDVRDALGRLEQVLDGQPVDTSRVVVLGHSAGGHLALCAAAWKLRPLRGVMSIGGMADLYAAWERDMGDGAVRLLLGGPPHLLPERYQRASPIRHLPFGVSQLLVHGREDDRVPLELAELFSIASRDAGDDVDMLTYEGGHYEPLDPDWVGFSWLVAWLRERLDLPRPR